MDKIMTSNRGGDDDTDKAGCIFERVPRPAKLKAFLWFTFSATAMLSSFILPIHVWTLAHGYSMNLGWLLSRLYFFILFTSALYHGLYRTKTIAFDIGLLKVEKILGPVLSIIFILCESFFVYRLFL